MPSNTLYFDKSKESNQVSSSKKLLTESAVICVRKHQQNDREQSSKKWQQPFNILETIKDLKKFCNFVNAYTLRIISTL